MMKAVILAGGRGERLRPLTDKIPKVMVQINNRPLLWYTITLFKQNGIQEISLLTGYLSGVVQKFFGDGKKFGVKISYYQENPTRLLGTAGAVGRLQNKLKETFLVCYGDVLRDLHVKNLLAFHKKKGGIGTICVYKNANPDPKSLISFDRNFRIKAFVERPKKVPGKIIWSNASCYVLEPEIFDLIPKRKPSDFGKDVFPKVLKAGKSLYAYKQEGYFLDVGNLEKLKKAKLDIESTFNPHLD